MRGFCAAPVPVLVTCNVQIRSLVAAPSTLEAMVAVSKGGAESVKFALIDFGASMIKAKGLLTELVAPVKFRKEYPALGVAVMLAVAPLLKKPPALTEPPVPAAVVS